MFEIGLINNEKPVGFSFKISGFFWKYQILLFVVQGSSIPNIALGTFHSQYVMDTRLARQGILTCLTLSATKNIGQQNIFPGSRENS